MLKKKKLLTYSVVIVLGAFISVVIYFYFYTTLYPGVKNFFYRKFLFERECYKKGGEIVSSNEVSFIVHHPDEVCAFRYSDAGKECFDGSECQGACILERYSYGWRNESEYLSSNPESENKIGSCQRYKNMECFIERKEGRIILHHCPIE
ncbi:hypothetical protein JXA63_02040 [Candidatus Woesebacteria bacterium]|nr:hypothetical protein [Candidatus Woesebacteria bacterium]